MGRLLTVNPWIIGKDGADQNDGSYKIRVTKTRKPIPRNNRHEKMTPITAEQYL